MPSKLKLPPGAPTRIAKGRKLTATQFYNLGQENYDELKFLRNLRINAEIEQMKKEIKERDDKKVTKVDSPT